MKKIIFIFILLLAITACTIEQETDNNSTISSTTDSSQDQVTTPSSSSELNIGDFPGADRIVKYTGKISEDQKIMKSSLGEYFSYELDTLRLETYNFKALRVYYGDQSIFYLTEVTGSLNYQYHEEETELSSDKTRSDSISHSISISESGFKSKIGTLSADGEIEFGVFANFYNNNYNSKANRVIVNYDGSSETKETTIDFSYLSAGGGSRDPCTPITSDNVLSNPGSCKLYISGDGSFSGSYTDIIYNEDDEGFSNQILTSTWSLTPINPIEEEIYLQ